MSQTISSTDCFENLIALKGACSDDVPTSSLWLNDLGIDMDFIGQVITKDYIDSADFFNRKKLFAIKTVANQIHNFLTPKYKSNTLLDNFRVGQFQDNLKLIAGTGTLKGIELDLCQSNSYLDVFINELALQISTTQSVDILVYDLVEGTLIDTFTIDAVANEITKIFVNKVYKSDKKRMNLFIGYDSTGISSNTTRLKKGCFNCSGNYQSQITNPYEKIRAAEIDSADVKTKENLTYLNETGGLSIVHSLSCNHESWLCSINNQLAFPILYKTAFLIYDHALSASQDQRVNTTVTINKETLQLRLDKMDFYFAESMNNLLQNIKPPSDEMCFVCRDNLRHVIMMP